MMAIVDPLEQALSNKEWDKAIGLLDGALRHQPHNRELVAQLADTLAQRGLELVFAGELAAAGPYLDRAVHVDATCAFAVAVRATWSMRMGRVEEGLAGRRQALQLQPTQEVRFRELGTCLSDLGRYDEALQMIDAGLVHHRSVSGLRARAKVLGLLGRFEEAVVTRSEVIEKEPTEPGHYFDRGDAHFQAGDYEAARVDYLEGCGREPTNNVHYIASSSAYLEAGDASRALQWAHMAVGLNPDNALALRVRSLAYVALGDGSSAARDAVRAAQLHFVELQEREG